MPGLFQPGQALGQGIRALDLELDSASLLEHFLNQTSELRRFLDEQDLDAIRLHAPATVETTLLPARRQTSANGRQHSSKL